MLPLANHYAHEMCVEILSRIVVSILRYLSQQLQFHKNEYQEWFLNLNVNLDFQMTPTATMAAARIQEKMKGSQHRFMCSMC